MHCGRASRLKRTGLKGRKGATTRQHRNGNSGASVPVYRGNRERKAVYGFDKRSGPWWVGGPRPTVSKSGLGPAGRLVPRSFARWIGLMGSSHRAQDRQWQQQCRSQVCNSCCYCCCLQV
ncbi:hypothetical protein BRADI_2g38254v3 [Brachypodium distachyon]|uniref:Uncharacterized protein n=1 Tax=Brachypodium distachyon TaxID=15368 RepID=A0A2K2DCI4_BRADI|nr:hypothetical protein BRADI_2g38254v3 [Brachypodium distachyon]